MRRLNVEKYMNKSVRQVMDGEAKSREIRPLSMNRYYKGQWRSEDVDIYMRSDEGRRWVRESGEEECIEERVRARCASRSLEAEPR
jgi:hypothetical protein